MLLLQYVKKDMHEVRFVKYPTKYQNENKIIHIGRGQIILFVSGKKAWKQILNFQLYQITDGMKTQTYARLKNPFQRYRRNRN